jgi:sugar (pentulose or hexulose) kinase
LVEKLTVVLDVGKTVAKMSLWSGAGDLLARQTRANDRRRIGEYFTLDVVTLERWIALVLRTFGRIGKIGSIIPVSHGAAAVVIRDDQVVAPPRDYEAAIAPELRAKYDLIRDPFLMTGSPRLPQGLNLGVQFFALQNDDPAIFDKGSTILLLPQYWAWVLSGIAASELTSLGCHTDLWCPAHGCPSTLAQRQGWAARLPPLRHARDVLGTILPSWAEETGLPTDVKVYCGLHDSNAALLAARGFAEIAEHEATVLSTGTWFVAMRSPRRGTPINIARLAEGRDCLVNVDVHGTPIPSARFMGGREIESLIGIDTRRIDIKPDQRNLSAAVPDVLKSGAMVLPSYVREAGPFRSRTGNWIDEPRDRFAMRAAVSLYAALVADVSLELIGARERILVEGRFAEAEVFVRALASLRPEMAIYVANAHNDVSYGALRLIYPDLPPPSALQQVKPLAQDIGAYRSLWHDRVKHEGPPS